MHLSAPFPELLLLLFLYFVFVISICVCFCLYFSDGFVSSDSYYVENDPHRQYINFRGFSNRSDGRCEVCHGWIYDHCNCVCLHDNIEDRCQLPSSMGTSLWLHADIYKRCLLWLGYAFLGISTISVKCRRLLGLGYDYMQISTIAVSCCSHYINAWSSGSQTSPEEVSIYPKRPMITLK